MYLPDDDFVEVETRRRNVIDDNLLVAVQLVGSNMV